MTQLKRDFVTKIKNIEHVASQTFRIRLSDPLLATHIHAGQFINIAIPHCKDILWRRPFSIHQTNPELGTFDILFHVVGRGTNTLATLQKDQEVQVLGPLGNSFTYPAELKEAIIVAGGLGVAPFVLMLQDLKNQDISKNVFYGVDTTESFCCLDDLRNLGAELYLTTEDGSKGQKGFVTDLLVKHLSSLPDMNDRMLYTCGPTPMLAHVQKIARDFNIKAEISVETMMACGFGACMGCPVPMTNPTETKKYYLACKDGPVFNLNEIDLNV